jgi:hypothetical protein
MSYYVPATKDEIVMRYDRGQSWPAVNIKVYGAWNEVKLPDPEFDPGFTHEWVERHISDEDMSDWFWSACEFELEYLIDYAKEIVGDQNAKFYQDGRSGGWLVYESDPEDWDAVAFAKWRKICRVARLIADGIPYQVMSLIHLNVYEMGKSQWQRTLTDKEALDKLAWLLSAPEWPGASGLEDVAEIVVATGRDIEQEGAEWPRH